MTKKPYCLTSSLGKFNKRVSMEDNKTSVNKIDVRKKKIIYKHSIFGNWLLAIGFDHEDINTILEEGKELYITHLKINQNSDPSMIVQIVEEFCFENNLKEKQKVVLVHFKIMSNNNNDFSMLPLISSITQQIIDATYEDADMFFSSNTCDISEVCEMDMIVVVVYK